MTLAFAASPDRAVSAFLVGLAVILATAFLFGALARRLRQPVVVGEIVAGLALGPSLLGLLPGHLPDLLFPAEARPVLSVLGQLGVVLFMFGVGYRFETSHVRSGGPLVPAVSVSSVALPFALGVAVAFAVHPWLEHTQPNAPSAVAVAIFLGAAMSVTAFPVLARILSDGGMEATPTGQRALASAALQDLMAWALLAVAVLVATVSGPWPLVRLLLLTTAFTAFLAWGVRPALVRLLGGPSGRGRVGGPLTVHAVLACGLLLSAWCTNAIGLHAVFGAFAFGVAVPRDLVERAIPSVTQRIDHAGLLLLPIFFTTSGLSVDVSALGTTGLLIMMMLIVAACVGKFVGAAGTALLCRAGRREATRLGILLNARGLTEIVLLNVGLELGVLDSTLFTGMVVMAIVTTIMTGPLLRLVAAPAETDGGAATDATVRSRARYRTGPTDPVRR